MRRSWMIWPGGLVALGLTLGCRHTQPQPDGCATCNNLSPATQPATVTPAPSKLALVPSTPPLVPAPQSVVTDDMPTVTVPSRTPAAAAVAPRSLPLVPTPPAAPAAPRPMPVAVNPEQSAPPAHSAPAPAPVPVPVPVVVQKPVLTERGATPPRPSTWVMPQAQAAEHAPAPITTTIVTPAPAAAMTSSATAPPYYNSPDYSILFGTLDYNRRTGVWRLRYADAGDEDRYGGCVTLDGIGRQMQDFASGQTVRVEGALVDAESKDVSPSYRVKDMRPVTTGK